MSRGLTIALGALGVVGCLAMLICFEPLRRSTADASDGAVSVWIYTPHVAPGDTLTLGVRVAGGDAIGIEDVTVTADGKTLRVRGDGATWGSMIVTNHHGAEDSLDVEVEVPRDATPGDTLRLAVEVAYVEAASSGSSFHNARGRGAVQLAVSVRSPTMRAVRRLLSGGRALATLGALCLLVWYAGPWLGWLNRQDGGGGEALGVLFIALLVLNGFVGYAVFILPLVAATAWTGSWLFVVAGIVWFAAPIWVAIKHRRRGGVRGVKGDLADFQLRPVVGRTLGTPYRTDAAAAHEVLAGAPRVDTTTHPIAVVEAALREVGLRATARGKLITIVDDRGRVATLRVRRPARVAIAGMTLRSRDNLVSIDVARALVPLYGPLRLSGPLLGLLIDGTRSRDEVIAEADAQFHKALGVLQQGLERTGAIMSQVQDSLRRRR
ncbi:MAG: hypothetical protein H6708_04725 [Kofleriaceae bacterium]|nr:hypothetical protein [Kofleriaceae bacterium]